MLNIETVKLKTEEEIINSWNDKEKIIVSVVCTTYNHESYIKDAITSFLMQETDFAFEIIIHDDASTDKTAAIIREYQSKYPNIIKPIFQEENQYSKGGFKPLIYAMGFVSGEYLALCEGDDFWTSKNKIQLQYRALLENQDIDFCIHSGTKSTNGVYNPDLLSRISTKSGKFSFDPESILKGAYAITASYFLRRDALERLPSWLLTEAPVGDVFIEYFSMVDRGGYFLDLPMCHYRHETSKGSWSASIESLDSLINHHLRMVRSFELIQEDWPQYASIVDKVIATTYLWLAKSCLLQGNQELFIKFSEASYLHFPNIDRAQSIYKMICRNSYMFIVLKEVTLLRRFLRLKLSL